MISFEQGATAAVTMIVTIGTILQRLSSERVLRKQEETQNVIIEVKQQTDGRLSDMIAKVERLEKVIEENRSTAIAERLDRMEAAMNVTKDAAITAAAHSELVVKKVVG